MKGDGVPRASSHMKYARGLQMGRSFDSPSQSPAPTETRGAVYATDALRLCPA